MKYKLLSKSFKKLLTELNCDLSQDILDVSKRKWGKKYNRNFTIKSNKREISYCPKGMDTIITSNGNWSSETRTSVNLRTGIRRILTTLEIDPQMYDVGEFIVRLTNKLKNLQYKIVRGEDIMLAYQSKLVVNKVKLKDYTQSCMSERQDQFYDLYVLNPQISMIIAIEGNYIIGRSIIWEDKYHDREYGTDRGKTVIREAFNILNIKRLPSKYCVKLSQSICRKYPYMDNVRYINFTSGLIATGDVELYGASNIACTSGSPSRYNFGNTNETYDWINNKIIKVKNSIYKDGLITKK